MPRRKKQSTPSSHTELLDIADPHWCYLILRTSVEAKYREWFRANKEAGHKPTCNPDCPWEGLFPASGQ